jgi:hypothetical protein
MADSVQKYRRLGRCERALRVRSYLGEGHGAAARVDLRAVLDRLAAQNPDDLSDDEALELAVEEVKAARAERQLG